MLHFTSYTQGYMTPAQFSVPSESWEISHGCFSTVVNWWGPARLHCLQIFQQFWIQVFACVCVLCVCTCSNSYELCGLQCFIYIIQYQEWLKWWRELMQLRFAVVILTTSMQFCIPYAKVISWILQVRSCLRHVANIVESNLVCVSFIQEPRLWHQWSLTRSGSALFDTVIVNLF